MLELLLGGGKGGKKGGVSGKEALHPTDIEGWKNIGPGAWVDIWNAYKEEYPNWDNAKIDKALGVPGGYNAIWTSEAPSSYDYFKKGFGGTFLGKMLGQLSPKNQPMVQWIRDRFR